RRGRDQLVSTTLFRSRNPESVVFNSRCRELLRPIALEEEKQPSLGNYLNVYQDGRSLLARSSNNLGYTLYLLDRVRESIGPLTEGYELAVRLVQDQPSVVSYRQLLGTLLANRAQSHLDL